jgi:hypothetical protein
MASRDITAFRAEAVPQAAKQSAMPKQALDKWGKWVQQGKLAGLDQQRVQSESLEQGWPDSKENRRRAK